MDSKGQKVPEKIISAAELDQRAIRKWEEIQQHVQNIKNRPAVVVAAPIAPPMTPERLEKLSKEATAAFEEFQKDNKCYQLIKKLDKTEVSAQEYKGRVEIMDTPEFRKAIQDAKLSADEITLIQWTEVPDWIKNETLDVLYMDSKGQKIPEKIISAAELDRRMNHDLQNANQPAAAVVVAEPIAQPMTPEEYEKAFKEIAALSDELLKDNKCYQLILKLFDKDVPGQEYKGRVEIVDIPKFRTAIQKAKLSAEEMELIQWTEMPNWVKNEKLDILIVKDADP